MDPWNVLKIKKGSDARTVKRAYRKRSKETHPDLNPGSSGEEFRQVAWAYNFINNPSKAGPSPVEENVKREKKKEKKKEKAKRQPSNWGFHDPTLNWFDPDHRAEEIVKPNPSRAEKRYEPKRKVDLVSPLSAEDLLRAEKDSKLGKKWAERMRSKRIF